MYSAGPTALLNFVCNLKIDDKFINPKYFKTKGEQLSIVILFKY